jgi:hypothetical protein
MDKVCLLDDEGMRNFIINGYITVQTDFPADFHKRVYQQAEAIFEKEGNPGNDILPKVQSSSAPHQAMWRHLWNWFCGGKRANGMTPFSDESGRLDAADALGVRGASARDAIPALISALRDESEAVRLNAAYVLGAIGEPALRRIQAPEPQLHST